MNDLIHIATEAVNIHINIGAGALPIVLQCFSALFMLQTMRDDIEKPSKKRHVKKLKKL